MEWTNNLTRNMKELSHGAFLTVSKDGVTNTMTISWGFIGYMWNKPMFICMVRPQRYTYQLINGAKDFTVSIPLSKDYNDALNICGILSGRDVDKLAKSGLEYKPAKKTITPVIDGNFACYECNIVYSDDLKRINCPDEIRKQFYKESDEHLLVYGEILETY